MRPLPPSGGFLPEVYPVWSPAKFFCSGSLWLIRQGIQVTFGKVILAFLGKAQLTNILSSFTFFICLPSQGTAGQSSKFVSDSAVATGFS